jgi:hypothetical protein
MTPPDRFLRTGRKPKVDPMAIPSLLWTHSRIFTPAATPFCAGVKTSITYLRQMLTPLGLLFPPELLFRGRLTPAGCAHRYYVSTGRTRPWNVPDAANHAGVSARLPASRIVLGAGFYCSWSPTSAPTGLSSYRVESGFQRSCPPFSGGRPTRVLSSRLHRPFGQA